MNRHRKFLGRGLLYSAFSFAFVLSGFAQAKTALFDGLYINSQGVPVSELIQSAQSSVDIEIYEMQDQELRVALRGALSRGIQIRIIHDPAPLGTSCDVFGLAATDNSPSVSADCLDQRKLVREINSSKGGRYVAFNRTNLCGTGNSPKPQSCFQHGKLILVDQDRALISTGNFNDSNFCDLSAKPSVCNRDYSYVTSDAGTLTILQTIFNQDLEGKPYALAPLLAQNDAELLTVSPLSLDPLVTFIASAKTKIQLQNQYLKNKALNQALIDAARRGVQVEITVASLCAFAPPSASEIKAATAIYAPFDQAGIHTRMFTKQILVGGMPGYMHAKTIVVDGKRSWVGSVNGSDGSLTRNREFGIFFADQADVKRLSTQMTADQTDARGETWQESIQCLRDSKLEAPIKKPDVRMPKIPHFTRPRPKA